MNVAWIDILLIIVFVYFFIRGWRRGFLYLFFGFISFIVAFLIALRYSHLFSDVLSRYLGLPPAVNIFIAFFSIAFIIEGVISLFLTYVINRTPQGLKNSPFNRAIGAVFYSGGALVFLAGFLFFVLLIPVRSSLKENIRHSVIAPYVLALLETYGGSLPHVLNESVQKLTTFVTISPSSSETIPLAIVVDEKSLNVDYQSEAAMIQLLNEERSKQNLPQLSSSLSLQEVARSYSKRMLLGKYFSHIDPDGNDVGDRLSEQEILFLIAGENLAYAPDVTIAHAGLMNSEGHRKNILDPSFRRVGVGIIDAGIFGKMFTQIFAD